jgi:hypothetical protein
VRKSSDRKRDGRTLQSQKPPGQSSAFPDTPREIPYVTSATWGVRKNSRSLAARSTPDGFPANPTLVEGTFSALRSTPGRRGQTRCAPPHVLAQFARNLMPQSAAGRHVSGAVRSSGVTLDIPGCRRCRADQQRGDRSLSHAAIRQKLSFGTQSNGATTFNCHERLPLWGRKTPVVASFNVGRCCKAGGRFVETIFRTSPRRADNNPAAPSSAKLSKLTSTTAPLHHFCAARER